MERIASQDKTDCTLGVFNQSLKLTVELFWPVRMVGFVENNEPWNAVRTGEACVAFNVGKDVGLFSCREELERGSKGGRNRL